MSTKRIEWIDQVKGFAIVCMVISHAIPGYTNGLKNWITSFNMPLFFFLSGFLSKDKVKDWKDLPDYLKKKFQTIGIPYFIFCGGYLLFIAVLSTYAGEDARTIIGDLTIGVKNTLYGFGVQSMWFLPVHFFSMLLFDFFVTRIDNNRFRLLLAIGIIIFLLKIDSIDELEMWTRLLGRILAALVFIIVGNLFNPIFAKMTSIQMFICFAGISLLSLVNGFVSMNFDYGKYPILFFINAIVLSICICSLLKKAGSYIPPTINYLFSLYGRNSIAILVTNNVIIELLRLLDHKITGDFFLKSLTWPCLIFAVIILLLEYPIVQFADAKERWVFGKYTK